MDDARERAAEERRRILRHPGHRRDVDAGVRAHAAQQVREVLGADVARRDRREGAAAEPPNADSNDVTPARYARTRSRGPARRCRGKWQVIASRIVQRPDGAEQRLHLRRAGVAGRCRPD